MVLSKLLEAVEIINNVENLNIDITNVAYKCNIIENGGLYIFVKDICKTEDIEVAIKNGARAIIIGAKNKKEIKETEKNGSNVVCIIVEDERKAMAQIACNFYENPANELKIVGVTGTKGKTTTAYMARYMLHEDSKKVGMITKLQNSFMDKFEDSSENYESLDIQAILKRMLNEKIECVVIELSENDYNLYKYWGIKFNAIALTNIIPAYIINEKTIEEYINAELNVLESTEYVIVNGDDIYTPKLIKRISGKVATFGLDNAVNITGVDIANNIKYIEFRMSMNNSMQRLHIGIPGRNSVYNALAAVGICSLLGCSMGGVLLGLAKVKVPMHMEILENDRNFAIMLDGANTSIEAENLLRNIKKYTKGRVICVFGSDENLDKESRMQLGEAVGKVADFSVITQGGQKHEKVDEIIKDVFEGMKNTRGMNRIVNNRKDAIKFAIEIAWRNDVVVIMGNNTQYDERKIVEELLKVIPKKEESTY